MSELEVPRFAMIEYHDKSLEAIHDAAMRVGGAEMMSPFSQFWEQQVLEALFGNFIARVNQTISAPAAATTSITIEGTIGSGNADTTPVNTDVLLLATPGSGTTINQYTNPDIVTATGGSGTSITIASQTIGKSRAPLDCVFLMGTTAAALGGFRNNTYYIGLTTQAVSGATQANVLSGEPTLATGGYQRIAVLNNPANFPAASAASPSVVTCGGPFSFPQSTAAWSTGSTNLAQGFLCDNSSGTSTGTVNVLAFGALGTPQAVNAANITLSFASAQITITLT